VNHTDALVDLRARCVRAAAALDELAAAASPVPEFWRLSGKADGIRLALSYIDDQLREQEVTA